ncbi:MAG: hypothetical protein WKG07_32700 [Hymenobacter sp.]
MMPPSEPKPCAWPAKAARPRPPRARSTSTPNASISGRRKRSPPVAAARGAALDPATAAELRQLRAANRRQAQELEILKKAIASKRFMRVISQTETYEPLPLHRGAARPVPRAAALPGAGRAGQRATTPGNRLNSRQ